MRQREYIFAYRIQVNFCDQRCVRLYIFKIATNLQDFQSTLSIKIWFLEFCHTSESGVYFFFFFSLNVLKMQQK